MSGPSASDTARSAPFLLETELETLVGQLRDEATAYKECFTRYAFYGVGFSGAVLGLVIRFLPEKPHVGLAGIVVVFLALALCRLGTYKYTAANRENAYELHLYRTKDVPPGLEGRWKPAFRKIGWEEAMRAWRIVQATVFERVYWSPMFFPEKLRKEFRDPDAALWFSQETMLGNDMAGRSVPRVVYYPGSYLRTMLLLLHAVAGAGLSCLIAATWRLYLESDAVWVAYCLVAVLVFLATAVRIAADHSRRWILEDGLLSIHASAIVWQAVVVAHFAALERARTTDVGLKEMRTRSPLEVLRAQTKASPDGAGYLGYTYWLADEARSLAQRVRDIHGWIGGRYSPARSPSSGPALDRP